VAPTDEHCYPTEEVFADLPRIHEGLDLLGIHWIQDNQGEADDVIASLIVTHPRA
jgi:hypothetical protein